MSGKKVKNLILVFVVILVLSVLFFQMKVVGGDSYRAVIDESLIEIAKQNPLAEVEVILILEKDSDLLWEVKEEVKNYESEIDEYSEEVKRRFGVLKGDLNYEENKEGIIENFRTGDERFLRKLERLKVKHELTEDDLGVFSERIDDLRTRKNKEIYRILKESYEPIQMKVIEEIEGKRLGEVVYQDFTTNMIVLKIYVKDLGRISKIEGIHEIVSNEWVDEDESDVSVPTIGTDTWKNNGYFGNQVDILFLNSNGIYTAHSAIDHLDWFSTCYVSPPCDAESPTNGHDTLVAGIIGSDDGTYEGVSPGMDRFYNGMTSNFGQAVDAVNWAVINMADSAEHITMSKSFGGGVPPYCGDYPQEEYVDEIVDLLDVNWVKSAGNNGGQANKNVTLPAGAYNIIAVGESNDYNTPSRNDDTLGLVSSQGPVGICGSGETRIKPDITAPGVGITSTNEAGGFSTWGGTSFAAPHVTGSLVLLEGRYGSVFSTLEERALLFNTAEDRDYNSGASGSDGPDNKWGYGYLDMEKAYFEGDNVDKISFVGEDDIKYYLTSSTTSGEKVTGVWNRHIVNNNGITNNLDLFLYDETNGLEIDSSTYVGRNIEQVEFDETYSSSVLKIFLEDINVGIGEDVGLAFSNSFAEVNGPALSINLTYPHGLVPMCNSDFNLTATITNNGGISAHNVDVMINLPNTSQIVSGGVNTSVGTIAPGASVDVDWRVHVENHTMGRFDFIVDFISESYGETYSGYGKAQIRGVCKMWDCVVQPPIIPPHTVSLSRYPGHRCL